MCLRFTGQQTLIVKSVRPVKMSVTQQEAKQKQQQQQQPSPPHCLQTSQTFIGLIPSRLLGSELSSDLNIFSLAERNHLLKAGALIALRNKDQRMTKGLRN